jgi:type II secretory pathway component PulC
MKLLSNLLSTDYGIMSIIVIVAVIVMSAWYYRYFSQKMDEDAKNAGE